jgi:hypothetical protein
MEMTNTQANGRNFSDAAELAREEARVVDVVQFNRKLIVPVAEGTRAQLAEGVKLRRERAAEGIGNTVDIAVVVILEAEGCAVRVGLADELVSEIAETVRPGIVRCGRKREFAKTFLLGLSPNPSARGVEPCVGSSQSAPTPH